MKHKFSIGDYVWYRPIYFWLMGTQLGTIERIDDDTIWFKCKFGLYGLQIWEVTPATNEEVMLWKFEN
jgi:hypothetical protein